MHVRSTARWRTTAACAALIVGSLLVPQLALGQVTRYEYRPSAIQVSTNGPSGVSYPISVTAEGRINDFNWDYSPTNASAYGNLHIRFTLPDGTYFDQVAGTARVDTSQVYGKNALGTWTMRLTESQSNRSESITPTFSVVAIRDARTDLQASGVTVPELAYVDTLIMDFMRTNQVEAATVAVMRNGRLVLSKGYGWQDRARTTLTLPTAVGRWASNTKAVTAAAIRLLVNQGKLSLDSRAWDVMNVPPPSGYGVADSRHYQYTIDELLHHHAGVRRDLDLQAGPLGAKLGLGRAATLTEMVAYQWTIPLDYDPIPDDKDSRSYYSNWGYQLLGAIIEKVSGMSYDSFVRTYVTGPIGATTFQVGRRGPGNALPNELWYAGHIFMDPQWDWNGSMAPVEDAYGDDLETRPGAGSLVSSAPDYMRFLKAYFQDGTAKPASLVGWEWTYAFDGAGPGNSSTTGEIVNRDGTSFEWAVLINECPFDDNAVRTLGANLQSYLTGLTTWPTIDLFANNTCTASPATPTGLTATAVSSSQINLSWSAVSPPTACSVTYSVFRNGTQVASGLTSPSYQATGLNASTAYQFYVLAVDAAGASASSSTASATTQGGSTCKAISGGQSGNFNTTGPVCFTVSSQVNGWGCANADGRTVTVNGTAVTCGKTPLPGSSPYTFSFSGGTYSWASFYWW